MDSNLVFAAIGVTPPPKQPAPRLRYRQADMARWASHRGLPLVREPRFWPTSPALAARVVIAAAQHSEDGAARLTGAMLDAVWARELDIADAETVRRLAAECGLDGAAVLAGAQGPEAADRFAANTQEAIGRGVLGSPTFVVGEDMFFGQDRLAFVGAAIGASPADAWAAITSTSAITGEQAR